MSRFSVILVTTILLLSSLGKIRTLACASELTYRTYQLPRAIVHTLLVPRDSQFLVKVEVATELMTVAEFAQQEEAIAVWNGGFFDPKNQQSTSFLVKSGEIEGDPGQNQRLMQNPDLQAYLPQILNRSEFRRYQCGNQIRYDLTTRQTAIPANCQLVDVLGGGPSLIPTFTGVTEGFLAYNQEKLIRDALGSQQPNARTAIGLKPNGDLLLVMVQQSTPTGGLSLKELAEFLGNLQVAKGINLDGGSSSSFVWQNQQYYGKISGEGQRIQRPVKSVLVVSKNIHN